MLLIFSAQAKQFLPLKKIDFKVNLHWTKLIFGSDDLLCFCSSPLKLQNNIPQDFSKSSKISHPLPINAKVQL